MVTAKNRALDQLRRFKLLQRKHQTIANDAELLLPTSPSPEEESDKDVGDDLLRLIFIACHPVLSTEARVALTLRLLGGLNTAESHARFWCRNLPLGSESCGPSVRWPKLMCLSRCRVAKNSQRGSHLCSK